MANFFKTLSKELKKFQSNERYKHSLSVAKLAKKLGKRHGWNPKQAELAGLLHDWAKEWKPSELIRYTKKHKLKIPDYKMIVKNNPNGLHAFVGAHVVRKNGWLQRNNEIQAIASHTFGSEKMSLEEKILYVADLASPDRRFREAKPIRKLALQNLQQGFMAALALKINNQLRKRRVLHPLAIAMWNHEVR